LTPWAAPVSSNGSLHCAASATVLFHMMVVSVLPPCTNPMPWLISAQRLGLKRPATEWLNTAKCNGELQEASASTSSTTTQTTLCTRTNCLAAVSPTVAAPDSSSGSLHGGSECYSAIASDGCVCSLPMTHESSLLHRLGMTRPATDWWNTATTRDELQEASANTRSTAALSHSHLIGCHNSKQHGQPAHLQQHYMRTSTISC
jgi:hypothetical protein